MEELESASNLLKSTQLMSFREDLNAHLLKLDICLPRAVFEKKKKSTYQSVNRRKPHQRRLYTKRRLQLLKKTEATELPTIPLATCFD